jgi:hypothetical protein
MEESVEQLKRLHAIEDVEQAIFALERGMPVHPRIIATINMIRQILIVEYNNTYAAEQQQAPQQEPTEG